VSATEHDGTARSASDLLDQLLRDHPEAALDAINEVALFVDVPGTIRLNGQQQSRGKSALDVFCPSDWEAVIAAWEVAQSGGVGRATVHLQSAPDVPHDMYVLDVRREALSRVLATGEDADVELTFLGPGGLRICQVALRTLRDRAGAVSGAIACLTDTTSSVQLRAQLHQRATYDPLTGCLNRGAVLAHVEQVLLDPSTGTGLAYCDVDRFTLVNDRYGHAAGDAVLRERVRRLTTFVRREQVVGRLGGDEFLVVLPDMPSEQAASELGERLRAGLSGPVELPGGAGTVPLEVSVGTAWARAGAAAALVAEADAAMYRAKRSTQLAAG
jgi:diguanylate cyclase (GGDEF)-like protein